MIFRYINTERFKKFFDEYLLSMLKSKLKKNYIHQAFDVFRLVLITKFWPHNYFKYKGYEKGKNISDISKYIPGTLFDSFRNDCLNDNAYNLLVDDKSIFNKILSDHNIEATNIIGYYFNKIIQTPAGESLQISTFFHQLKKSVVVKPVNGSAQGAGVCVVEFTPDENGTPFFKMKGDNFSPSDLASFFEKVTSKYGFIIEDKVVQHTEIAKIYKHSLNTIRVDTLRIPGNNDIFVISAYFRMGRNGRTVDNWSGKEGGIGVQVNLETGQLVREGVDYLMNTYTKHPDTGIVFDNLQLPFWDELIDLVRQAAGLFPFTNSLGWDVAITNNGPMLIEANSDYSLQASQSCTYPYLNNQELVSILKTICNANDKGRKYARYFPQ